jgi:hypothetical protein
MLNEPEFEFFRYCEGNWKITRWATKAYASWKCNHLDDRKTPCANKQKHKLLDDPTLLQIGNEPTEDMAMSITGCTAVKNCGSPSHIQLESDSDVMRVCPPLLHDCAIQHCSLPAAGHHICGSPVRAVVATNSLCDFADFLNPQ